MLSAARSVAIACIILALALSATAEPPRGKKQSKERGEALLDQQAESIKPRTAEPAKAKPAGADEPTPAAAPVVADDYQRIDRAGEWEMIFEEGITADEYARQLDFFGIELGVVAKDGKIQYATRLSDPKAEKSIGTKESEKRISIGWKRGTLLAVDRKILARAGINTTDKKLLHYYPRAAETQLSRLEHEFAGVPLDQIKRTRFGIRAAETVSEKTKPTKRGDIKLAAAAYEFYVIEQEPFAESPGAKLHQKPADADHARRAN